MVNDNKEEKPLLSFQDKDGNPREIFERDLNDTTRPLVQEISQDLNAEQQLGEAYQLATKTDFNKNLVFLFHVDVDETIILIKINQSKIN